MELKLKSNHTECGIQIKIQSNHMEYGIHLITNPNSLHLDPTKYFGNGHIDFLTVFIYPLGKSQKRDLDIFERGSAFVCLIIYSKVLSPFQCTQGRAQNTQHDNGIFENFEKGKLEKIFGKTECWVIFNHFFLEKQIELWDIG